MNLQLVNPYYRKPKRARFIDANSYQYTWITPVTDRTQTDVDYAKTMLSISWDGMTTEQQAEFLTGYKGCMNTSDLGRIENNIQILLDVLEIDSTTYVDEIPEFVTEDYFQQMHDNVEAIRTAYFTYSNTPETPELPFNTWQKFNDVEKILADVYGLIMANFSYYAGEIYAGDTVGLVL